MENKILFKRTVERIIITVEKKIWYDVRFGYKIFVTFRVFWCYPDIYGKWPLVSLVVVSPPPTLPCQLLGRRCFQLEQFSVSTTNVSPTPDEFTWLVSVKRECRKVVCPYMIPLLFQLLHRCRHALEFQLKHANFRLLISKGCRFFFNLFLGTWENFGCWIMLNG